jgi:hypothetical protein
MVVEIKYLIWTEDGLLRHTIYQGVREDKPVRHRPNVVTDSMAAAAMDIDPGHTCERMLSRSVGGPVT